MVCQSTMRKAPKAPCKTIIKLSGKENVYIESKSVLRKRQGGSLWHRKEPVTEFHRETASCCLPCPLPVSHFRFFHWCFHIGRQVKQGFARDPKGASFSVRSA